MKDLLEKDGDYKSPVTADHRNRMEMNGIFTWELGKGEHSRILFRKDGVELAELVYNPKYTDRESTGIGIANVESRTVPQKPDIVLQLTKDNLQQGMKMTYLFDAKYRIEGKTEKGVDLPPEDAINQMHRYRDAIYYKDGTEGGEALKKEVIGGYILFPGDGSPIEVANAKFQQSLDEVNIGAFPLRPKDKENRKLLEDFIEGLIGRATTDILNQSIPQKGLYYTANEPKDAIYMILALDKDVNEDMTAIVEGRGETIVMGRLGMEETKDIGAVRYIAPIIPGGHIEGYYQVKKANLKRVKDAAYPIRIKFDVCDWVKLERPVRHGSFPIVFRGICKTREQFFKYCKEKAVY